MFKKIIILVFLILNLGIYWSWYAATDFTQPTLKDYIIKENVSNTAVNNYLDNSLINEYNNSVYNEVNNSIDEINNSIDDNKTNNPSLIEASTSPQWEPTVKNLNKYNDKVDNFKDNARTKGCAESWNCIDKETFRIDVSTISPWMSIQKWSTSKTINYALGTIIQTLMIGLGSLSLLIMTVGAWYMVLHNWQDELLNKWKSIFMSWIYSMIVALSSYYIIVIVRYILYA